MGSILLWQHGTSNRRLHVASRVFKSVLLQTLARAGEPVAKRRRSPELLPPVSREQFRRMIPAPALEIGPFDEPFLPNAEYFDILDQEGLKKRAVVEGRNPEGCPFIHHTGSLQAIKTRFKSVFSSHTIEHVPDLIAHLQEVSALLESGGAYYLIIPDKRYCFDHYLPESSFADVLAGRGRSKPTDQAIRDHRVNVTHNVSPLHWVGFHGRKIDDRAAAHRDVAAWEAGEYIDVHQWQFTPRTFRGIMGQLPNIEGVAVFDTAFGSMEFMAILSFVNPVTDDARS